MKKEEVSFGCRKYCEVGENRFHMSLVVPLKSDNFS